MQPIAVPGACQPVDKVHGLASHAVLEGIKITSRDATAGYSSAGFTGHVRAVESIGVRRRHGIQKYNILTLSYSIFGNLISIINRAVRGGVGRSEHISHTDEV